MRNHLLVLLVASLSACNGSTRAPDDAETTVGRTAQPGLASWRSGGSATVMAPMGFGSDYVNGDPSVGGAVQGLGGADLVLANNGTDLLPVTGDGAFIFDETMQTGDTYAVTVQQQPDGQHCTVASGSGIVGVMDVTDVVVTCEELVAPAQVHVGGLVSGLTATGLILLDNGADALAVDSDGRFVFPTTIATGSSYAVTVQQQPSDGSQCVVTGGNGTASADLDSVQVVCAPVTYTIGGTVTGLGAGKSVVLGDGMGTLTVSASGTFTMPSAFNDGDYYAVTIAEQPVGAICSVTAGDWIMGASVGSIVVTCSDAACANRGWKAGNDDWTCPAGYRMPTASEWSLVAPCFTADDQAAFDAYHDVATSVGGCGCGWNATYCDAASIQTIHGTQMCGDYAQLQVCIPQ